MQKQTRPSFFASLFGRSKKAAPKNKVKEVTAPRPFQAIAIQRGTSCCAAAKDVDGYKFLARHAPPLPLKGCTQRDKCQCRPDIETGKFQDRRGSPRRLVEFGIKPTLFSATDKRKAGGRRSKD